MEQNSEKTKGLRKMIFSSKEDILKHKSIIQDYIEEAIINASKGKEIPTVRNKDIVTPSLLQQEFNINPIY